MIISDMSLIRRSQISTNCTLKNLISLFIIRVEIKGQSQSGMSVQAKPVQEQRG